MKRSSIVISMLSDISYLISGENYMDIPVLKKNQVGVYTHSKGKAFTKGKRSKSLKIRSNRRKGK